MFYVRLARPTAWRPRLGQLLCPQMEEYGLVTVGDGSEFASHVKAVWNCLLLILALSFASVLRIPFSKSEVIP